MSLEKKLLDHLARLAKDDIHVTDIALEPSDFVDLKEEMRHKLISAWDDVFRIAGPSGFVYISERDRVFTNPNQSNMEPSHDSHL